MVNYAQDQAAAEATVAQLEQLGARALAVRADVAKLADIERLFETTRAAFGKIDIVVMNAGVELVNLPVADFTEA